MSMHRDYVCMSLMVTDIYVFCANNGSGLFEDCADQGSRFTIRQLMDTSSFN